MLIPNQTINETRASAIESNKSRPSAFNIKLPVVVGTIISAIPIPGNVQTESHAALINQMHYYIRRLKVQLIIGNYYGRC